MQQFLTDSQLPATSGHRKSLSGDVTSDPDIPPESFWLSKDAEFDWFDRHAFLDRNSSTRGSFSSTSFNQIVNPSHSNSTSQRYSSKSKAAIIGLPKTQKTTFVDSKRRMCKPVNVRLFPTRSFSVGKVTATVPVMEPSSPKVSCIGRVRSKRCRSRNRRKSSGLAIEPVRSASQRSGRVQKTGLLSKISSLFRHKRRKNGKVKVPTEKVKVVTDDSNSVRRKIFVSVEPVKSEPETLAGPVVKLVNSEPATPTGPPGLGGMIRFASGHRTGCWDGSEEYDVAGCGLDSGVLV